MQPSEKANLKLFSKGRGSTLRHGKIFCPLQQQQNVGRKENTERERNSTLKLCGVLRTQHITKKHQFNFTQTYPNMGCVNTLMLDFEIALNVWTIQIRSHGASGDKFYTTDIPVIQFVCACWCEYVCPTRYDSTSWWRQRGLIKPADHLLLQANHWRYKGVLCKHTYTCMCRTKCSQNSSFNPAKSQLQQICLGGICLYCMHSLFST